MPGLGQARAFCGVGSVRRGRDTGRALCWLGLPEDVMNGAGDDRQLSGGFVRLRASRLAGGRRGAAVPVPAQVCGGACSTTG